MLSLFQLFEQGVEKRAGMVVICIVVRYATRTWT
ncbi:hypothetical protein SAMN05216330_12627 [Bradyrhizobium sp. Ghvi]|nr:hypothetical protein SAMN05216330_12627 [Bradyrhizobium sp. Ghvi]